MKRWAPLAAVVAVLTLAATVACGGQDEPRLTVLAAASLTDVLPSIDSEPRYSFAGSNTLATQIREGAPVDVYVAANSRYPTALETEGLLVDIRVVAQNRLVIVVPPGNPAGIESVGDLVDPDLRIVVARETVPVGEYTRDALETLGITSALDNVMSNEEDVKAVVAKVVLGEVDAGIAYATDVAPVGDRVETVAIPEEAQPQIDYLAGIVAKTSNLEEARHFLDELASEDGRSQLLAAGFLLP